MSGGAGLAAGAVTREAARILPLLLRPRTVLAAAGEESFGVLGPRSGWAKPMAKLSSSYLREFLSREWIAPLSRPDWLPASISGPLYGAAVLAPGFVRRQRGGDGAFADQHRVMEDKPLEAISLDRPVRVNIAETPLGWLRQRRGKGTEAFLTETEYEAGEKLRRDFILAGLEPSVTSHWQFEKVDVSVRTDYSDRVGGGSPAAKARFWRAVDALGPELAAGIVSTCCFLQGLETMERRLGLPRRSGKMLLKIGLKALARHYGFEPGDTGRAELAGLLGGRPLTG